MQYTTPALAIYKSASQEEEDSVVRCISLRTRGPKPVEYRVSFMLITLWRRLLIAIYGGNSAALARQVRLAMPSDFDSALLALTKDVLSTISFETGLSGRGGAIRTKPKVVPSRKKQCSPPPKPATAVVRGEGAGRDTVEATRRVVDACKEERRMEALRTTPPDYSAKALSEQARFTDRFCLHPYSQFLHYVPRLVNVVTVSALGQPLFRQRLPPQHGFNLRCVQLAEAIPVERTGMKLPLDLHLIAARCKNSFYAPQKFSAVQLAYSEPRCRVLVFRARYCP